MSTRVKPCTSLMRSTAACAACGVLLLTAPGATRAQEIPPPAYQSAARTHGVPASLLFAIALQESGMTLHGRLVPWPWTLNVAGHPLRYANLAQACSALRDALRRVPPKRIDVGLGQINVGFHGRRVAYPCALLNPYQNLALVAVILREHYTPAGDWSIAVGHYHRP